MTSRDEPGLAGHLDRLVFFYVDDRVLLQVGFYDVPHGRAFGALVHGRPAGDHVVARRVDRLARCQQGHFGDARADRLPRVDAVAHATDPHHVAALLRSEEHTSELQSLMRNSYAVFCLKKKNTTRTPTYKQSTLTTNTHQCSKL